MRGHSGVCDDGFGVCFSFHSPSPSRPLTFLLLPVWLHICKRARGPVVDRRTWAIFTSALATMTLISPLSFLWSLSKGRGGECLQNGKMSQQKPSNTTFLAPSVHLRGARTLVSVTDSCATCYQLEEIEAYLLRFQNSLLGGFEVTGLPSGCWNKSGLRNGGCGNGTLAVDTTIRDKGRLRCAPVLVDIGTYPVVRDVFDLKSGDLDVVWLCHCLTLLPPARAE